MYDEKFQTFILQVLFNQESNAYKKECLWVLSNILGGPSEDNFEFILENKNLLQQIVKLSSCNDYQVRKEALVTLYNLCENHNNKYLSKVLQQDPSQAFFSVLQHYQDYDPYMLKIAISYCSLICEKLKETAVRQIIREEVNERIDNISSRYCDNEELVQLCQTFLDTYITESVLESEGIIDNDEAMDYSSQRQRVVFEI